MEQQTTQPATTPTTATFAIHPDTHIGMVTLRVADLDRSLRFYGGVLGFQVVERQPGKVTLGGQDKQALLELREVPGAQPQPQWSTGLYHVAILLPSRPDLGRALLRLAEAGWRIGQGDHLVSEALYISDPDGNGLEIYQDRPRDTWQWTNGQVKMATDPVNLRSLMEEGMHKAQPWEVLPAGTKVGHIHLQVGDIPQAKHFYSTILGFDITASMPSALFISAGGYHHHIGMNTWQSAGANPAPESGAGLHEYVIAIPNRETLTAIQSRLAAHNIAFEEQDNALIVADPWHNTIRLAIV